MSAITAMVVWRENKANSAAPGDTWNTLCFQKGRWGGVGGFDHTLGSLGNQQIQGPVTDCIDSMSNTCYRGDI